MSDRNKEIIKQIEDIEEQLKRLRIELGSETPFKKTGPYKVGEEVVILNPRNGQGKSGKLLKANQITRYATIDTINTKGHREKVVQSFGKIKRKQTET